MSQTDTLSPPECMAERAMNRDSLHNCNWKSSQERMMSVIFSDTTSSPWKTVAIPNIKPNLDIDGSYQRVEKMSKKNPGTKNDYNRKVSKTVRTERQEKAAFCVNWETSHIIALVPFYEEALWLDCMCTGPCRLKPSSKLWSTRPPREELAGKCHIHKTGSTRSNEGHMAQ